jgi:GT2 family glycosyltransferase
LQPMTHHPLRLSIIVPVCNNPRDLRESLAALIAGACSESEIIVVDDASTDETRSVAAEHPGVRVLRLAKNSGPSSARNLGAREAKGDILFFVDADVVVAPDAVSRVVRTLDEHPEVAAVFGSYDDRPRAQGLVSQYRNLLHHYVHQRGQIDASTFWGACGAIRRSVFEQVGGFDEERYPRCIEDIELGYRLRRAGHRIVLDKQLQGTHLKKWTLRSVIRTDIRCRAMPWTRLILDTQSAPDDLNLRDGQRVSVGLVGLACLALLLAPFYPATLPVAAVPLLAVMTVNRHLYAFFVRHRGVTFTAGALGLHLLYFLYGGLTYLYVWCDCRLWGGRRTLTLSQGVKPLGASASRGTASRL